MTNLQEFVNRRAVSLITMRRAIESQAALVHGVMDFVRPQVQALVSRLDVDKVTNVFTVGCGDSLYAAMATRFAFEKYSGLRVEPMEALEFSRYTVDYLPVGSLVVGISAGGNKSRPAEAIQEARRNGAATVVITGERSSPFTAHADHVILQNEYEFRVPAPEGEGTFKIGNYIASMIGLYLLALALGRARGVLSGPGEESALTEMRRASRIVSETIEANDARMREYAAGTTNADAHYILGGGPNYATALFTAAKLFELPQKHGVPVELEEWAHEQYFLTRPGTAVIILAAPGASVDRAREQMAGAKDMGARVAVVCDPDDAETRAQADVAFIVRGALREEFSPLTYCVPGQLLALELSRALGKPAFDFISSRQYETNRRQISASHMRGT
jgi:glutamine---fructose-6-phosphate transaminase (isomerizing)